MGNRVKLTIWGSLPSLNEYTAACRSNPRYGNQMKKEAEQIVTAYAYKTLKRWRASGPVFMAYTWFEKNKRRDKDNIAFGRKFIQDALVKAGYLKDDGWDEIVGFSDSFRVDKKEPRIEVIIEEVNDEK